MSDDRVKGQAERRCPRCFYNLHGLPEPCDCPKCGEHIDAGARMWRSASTWTTSKWSCIPLFLAWLFVCALDWWNGGFSTFSVIEKVFLFFFVAWLWWVTPRDQILYIDQAGIRFHTAPGRLTRLPWRMVRDVCGRRSDRNVDLVVDMLEEGGGTRVASVRRHISLECFAAEDDVVACIDRMKQMLSGAEEDVRSRIKCRVEPR